MSKDKKNLKVITYFSGIGAPEKSLEKIKKKGKLNYECLHFCEIDENAATSFSAIHNIPSSKNLKDITKVNGNDLPKYDLAIAGSPCQDFSVSGKKRGASWKCKDCKHEYNPLTVNYKERTKCPLCSSLNIEKTRSSLIVEFLRVIEANKPNYIIYENVKNLKGKNFTSTYSAFLQELKDYGYDVYETILDSKHYGIPQNRERVFVVAIKTSLKKSFKFPDKIKLETNVRDLLEKNVDESYNVKLSEKLLEKLSEKSFVNNKKMSRLPKRDKLTVTDIEKVRVIENCIQIGMIGDSGYEQIRRVYLDEGCVPTLTTTSPPKIAEFKEINPEGKLIYRIREITPRESFRFMGFSDEDFDKAVNAGVSKTQLNKQAGNSIVVNVMEAIIEELLK